LLQKLLGVFQCAAPTCGEQRITALLGSVEAFGSVRLLAERSKLSTG